MSMQGLGELISAIQKSGGVSINVIVLDMAEEDEKDDRGEKEPDMPFWDVESLGLMGGGASGGVAGMDGILQGINTP